MNYIFFSTSLGALQHTFLNLCSSILIKPLPSTIICYLEKINTLNLLHLVASEITSKGLPFKLSCANFGIPHGWFVPFVWLSVVLLHAIHSSSSFASLTIRVQCLVWQLTLVIASARHILSICDGLLLHYINLDSSFAILLLGQYRCEGYYVAYICANNISFLGLCLSFYNNLAEIKVK